MTQEEILSELYEVKKDMDAFIASRDTLHRRIHEMDGTPRQDVFVSWAMTQVILNSFILAVVRCEGLVHDLQQALDALEVPNNVVQLTCIKGDQNGSGE
jgi:hypothetical protein